MVALPRAFLQGEIVKDRTWRPKVQKWLPYWERMVAQHGEEKVFNYLSKGETKFLDRKDRVGLLQALGMRNLPGEETESETPPSTPAIREQ
jgi:hypothetical protein